MAALGDCRVVVGLKVSKRSHPPIGVYPPGSPWILLYLSFQLLQGVSKVRHRDHLRPLVGFSVPAPYMLFIDSLHVLSGSVAARIVVG